MEISYKKIQVKCNITASISSVVARVLNLGFMYAICSE